MRPLVLALALLSLPVAAAAEVLATLHSHNGTLPPPYRRDLSAEIDADGTVRLRACKGYGEASCHSLTAQADPAAVAGILAAARAAGLPGRPVAEDPSPPVGGGAVSGSVVVDGTRAVLPPFPAFPDLTRNADVLAAILAALPQDAMAAVQAAVGE